MEEKLRSAGFDVVLTGWNSSSMMGESIKNAKRMRRMRRRTFALSQSESFFSFLPIWLVDCGWQNGQHIRLLLWWMVPSNCWPPPGQAWKHNWNPMHHWCIYVCMKSLTPHLVELVSRLSRRLGCPCFPLATHRKFFHHILKMKTSGCLCTLNACCH